MKNNWSKVIKKFAVFLFLVLVFAVFYFCLIYIIKNLDDEIAKTILEYIKAVIWPVVVLFAIISFKKEVSKLIADIDAGEAYGVKFHRNKQQEDNNKKDLKIELEKVPDDEKNQLEKVIQEKEENLTKVTQTANQLQKELVSKNIELDFERIYNIIFASQINLLSQMNILGYLGNYNIMSHFILIKRATEPALNNWELSDYLKFLFVQGLIENKDTHTTGITIKGKAFLQYLAIMNYQKPGI